MNWTDFGSGYRFVLSVLIAGTLLSACGGGDAPEAAQTTAPPPSSPANQAPTIEGLAPPTATVGQSYSFQPSASDPEQDLVTFTIANKPAWASFDAAKGLLTGTPGASDAGGYENIEIAATDGKSVSVLPSFAITVAAGGTKSVTLAWDAPTQNADGSPIAALSGYRIHYGIQPQAYSNTVTVSNPSVTRYVVDTLPAGKYYFALTALTATGQESGFSDEVSTTLN
jgi:hypothetical protein